MKPAKQPEKKLPKLAPNQSAIAAILAEFFKIRCVQRDVSGWTRCEGVKTLVPFPPVKAGSGYNVAECVEWYKENVKPFKAAVAAKGETPDDGLKNRRSRLLDIKINKESGQWIDRATAEQTAIGVIQRLKNYCVNQDESEMPNFCEEKLKALGVSPEIRSQFKASFIAYAQQMTDRRLNQFSEASLNVLEEQE